MTRRNHLKRLQAFDELVQLKTKQIPRKNIIDEINSKFEISIGTLYDWYSERIIPHGRKGKIKFNQELFYVLGALLGDGCAYKWRDTNNYLILAGDENFTKKYAGIINKCTDKIAKAYISRTNNIWFVKVNNYELYTLFEKIRSDVAYLEQLIKANNVGYLYMVEGFFDAEGCVKVIKEECRKTPKICLDITNTNFDFLEVIRKILDEKLNIISRYSIQKENKEKNTKKAYHLRIYKKSYIKTFFEQMSTIKLYPEKAIYLQNWLNNGK